MTEDELAAGADAFNRGDFGAAVKVFARLAKKAGAKPETHLFLAYGLRSLGRLSAAEDCLRRLVRRHPASAGARRALAEVLWARGRLPEALRWARRAALGGADAQALAVRKAIEAEVAASAEAARRERWLERSRVLKEALVAATDKACSSYLAGRRREAADWMRRVRRCDGARLRQLDEPEERFRALVRLGRYAEACRLGEEFLEQGPTLAQVRAFWNPWGGLPRPLVPRRHGDSLARLAKGSRWFPMGLYLLGAFRGQATGEDLGRLLGLEPMRYGWMLPWLSQHLLAAGRWDDAVAVARKGIDYRPFDWMSRFRLAEALICAGRETEALEQAAAAVAEAPRDEAASAVSWKGELDLWLGRYEEAYEQLGVACRAGADLAWCWRGAAALQLGRPAEAVELLDEGLRRLPGDLEARVWRGEARRRLGQRARALKDLGFWPSGFWAIANRALLKAEEGDEAGLRREFARLPEAPIRFVRDKIGAPERPGPGDLRPILEAALVMARGFRRDDYQQAVWARRKPDGAGLL